MGNNDVTYIGNVFQLTYRTSIIKMAISTLAFFVVFFNLRTIPAFFRVLLIVVGFITLLVSVEEIAATMDNKKFAIMCSSAREITECKSVSAHSVNAMLQKYNKMYCVIISSKTAYRIGTDYIWRRPPEETKHYYIDIVQDNKIHRKKYLSFEMFSGKLLELQDSSGTFNVAYWDHATEQRIRDGGIVAE